MIIFDSGVGGFSISRLLPPTYSYTYLADQAFFPYGSKDSSILKARLAKIATWAAHQHPDLFVIACNTATVGGVEIFRQHLTCPVVAVEPVVKMARGNTLILATSATLASPRMQELVKQSSSQIFTYTPRGLPQAIESMNIRDINQILRKVKQQVELHQIDSLGLSCTHYPLIKPLLSELLPDITLLDPSTAVISQIFKLLSVPSTKVQTPSTFFTTGDVLRFKEQISEYLGLACEPSRATISS